MTNLTVEQILENIYDSLENDNEDIDTHIRHLKTAMSANNQTNMEVESSRHVQENPDLFLRERAAHFGVAISSS